jgi:hypothetical protein
MPQGPGQDACDTHSTAALPATGFASRNGYALPGDTRLTLAGLPGADNDRRNMKHSGRLAVIRLNVAGLHKVYYPRIYFAGLTGVS